MSPRLAGTLLLAAIGPIVAQQPPAQQAKETAGARELFFTAASEKETLPPIAKPETPPPPPPVVKKGSTGPKTGGTAPKRPPAATTAIVHLGLTYSLNLVNSATGTSQPADSDQTFHKGQCVGIDFKSNRSGYLYVLALQSSGDWQPLLPSPEMPDESNVLDPGQRIRVPSGYCFEIADPPGTETLFVVLARDPDEIYNLNEAIRRRATGTTGKAAAARLVKSEVDRLSSSAGGNTKVGKSGPSSSKGDAPNSVYVVNGSQQAQTRLVTQIRIRHQ